jgi:ribonuclease D
MMLMKIKMDETLQTGLYPEDKRISGEKVNNKYQENITSEELAVCELSWFKGETIVVDNLSLFHEVFPRLLGAELLGFDTETKPIFKKGGRNSVSLIQLSTGDLACLFRINKIGIPDELVRLLSDSSVIKAGVAVHDDIRFLKSVRKFSPEGFVDLQTYVKDYGIQSSGLKKLAAIILGFRISKRQQVTDWEAEQLTEAQQIYAATDAWVCHQIYSKLIAENSD